MPRPEPWSHSRLSEHGNCPKQFYRKSVIKDVVETRSDQMIWGEEVHEHFEKRIRDGIALPPKLQMHEEFVGRLAALTGDRLVENRIALNTDCRPCTFFDPNVWYRGVIDFGVISGLEAYLVDHKTGKQKNDFDQLKLFTLHTFYTYPDVLVVRAEYYWTQLLTTTGQTWTRDQIPELWAGFVPKLRAYADSFINDTWPAKQSGLCNGWCPVTDCEFWRPKRKRNH